MENPIEFTLEGEPCYLYPLNHQVKTGKVNACDCGQLYSKGSSHCPACHKPTKR